MTKRAELSHITHKNNKNRAAFDHPIFYAYSMPQKPVFYIFASLENSALSAG